MQAASDQAAQRRSRSKNGSRVDVMPDLASNLGFAGNRQHERGKGWIDSGVGEERSESICEHKSFAVMAQAAAVARAQSGRLR